MKDAVNVTKYSRPENIAVTLAIDTANLAAGTLMEVSGDLTADKAAADSTKVLGRLVKEPSAADELQAVETNFAYVCSVQLAETVVAGDHGQIGADSSAGAQRVKKWASASDTSDQDICMFLEGGDEDDSVLAGFWR